MGGTFLALLFFAYLLLHLRPSLSLPLCTDSTSPFTQTTPLSFCPYNGTVCCDSKQDLSLQKQFQAMKISDPGCASVVKSILCAKCDRFSAELFQANPTPRPVPLLCNSTVTSTSSRTLLTSSNYCSKVWDTCQNVSIMNSPFAVSLAGQPVTSNATKITDYWQSKSDFCNALGGTSTDDSVCFDGEPTILNSTGNVVSYNGMCLEKIGNGSYLAMAPHPDGSPRAFFSNQQGKIWLATIPEDGSGGVLGLDESSPFLDLTDEVHFDTAFGMMGMAFHPNFAQNGRFFASFNCDKSKWPGCAGRCACNSDVDCDPSKLGTDNGATPCQFQTVVAEFTANGTASQPSLATSAKPIEVRRIFTMGLPFTSHHGGQILFGPTDGYLYLMMGDGGSSSSAGDPYNFSQNKQSLLGKVMRLDVDTSPSAAEITKLGLWGNYSIPKDNPYREDKDLQPEIWSLGLRNPWRCSFDAQRPSYFMCGDVGQDYYEEVNMIVKNGNYGWRVFEGSTFYTPQQTPGGNTSLDSIRPISPIMGYNHSEVNKNEGSASITGGYFYRSKTDPCLSGRYLYADLYAKDIWTGTEIPENSGNFNTSKISFSCASDTPIACISVPGSSLPSLGYVFSFGEDNNKDIYMLTSSGVYRVVRPSRCSYTCALENATSSPNSSPGSSPSQGIQLGPHKSSMILCLSLLLLVLSVF